MSLKEKLTVPRGNRSVNEYFQTHRCVADDLALINSPITKDDLVIHALQGIGTEFKEIIGDVKAGETEISFEELLDKMVDYETLLKKYEESSSTLIPTANLATRNNSSWDKNKK